MIKATYVECARCGQPLQINPPLDTGDLFLQVNRHGVIRAEARCKNIMVCDDWLAEHAQP